MDRFRLLPSYFVTERSFAAVMVCVLCPCLAAAVAAGCAAVAVAAAAFVEAVEAVVAVVAAAAAAIVVVAVEIGAAVAFVAAPQVVSAAESCAIYDILVSHSGNATDTSDKHTCACCILSSCCGNGSVIKFGICSTMYFTNALFGSCSCCTKAIPCGPKLLTACCCMAAA